MKLYRVDYLTREGFSTGIIIAENKESAEKLINDTEQEFWHAGYYLEEVKIEGYKISLHKVKNHA